MQPSPIARPAVHTTLSWVHTNLHHDDLKAIENWLAQGVTGNLWTSPACWLLGNLQSIQSELLPPLLAALASGPHEMQRTLLFGLARLAYCSGIPKEFSEPLRDAVAAVSQEIRASVCAIKDGPVTLLKVAKQVAFLFRRHKPLDTRRRRVLETQLLWVR